MDHIRDNVSALMASVPEGVIVVAAAKTRKPEEIMAAIDAGISHIGQNYVQEAEKSVSAIGRNTLCHFIGHLQKNKVKAAVRLFDLIETIDSVKIAQALDKECLEQNKEMTVLVEINSAGEDNKNGVKPEDAVMLIESISLCKNIKVKGLMTMGPFTATPDESRKFFKATRELFERISLMNIRNVEMKYLSMGMSGTYKVAIEEGADIVRIGEGIFGPRH